MANRIAGNVLIIDSAMGNLFVMDSTTRVINLKNYKVSSFAFWAADTTGNITLTGADTGADIIYKFDYLAGGGGSYASPNPITFDRPMDIGNFKVPRLTAGTGFIYLA